MQSQETDLFKLFSAYCYKKYKEVSNKCDTYNMYFSGITKIDNIKVRSRLQIPCSSRFNHMIFEIRDKFSPFNTLFMYSCFFEREQEDEDFTECQIRDMIGIINDLVPKLKFNKLTGMLQEYIEPFDGAFADGDQCCVCYEITSTKTKRCNHYICRLCFQQLKENFVCPMCRTRSQLKNDTYFEFSGEEDHEDD